MLRGDQKKSYFSVDDAKQRNHFVWDDRSIDLPKLVSELERRYAELCVILLHGPFVLLDDGRFGGQGLDAR